MATAPEQGTLFSFFDDPVPSAPATDPDEEELEDVAPEDVAPEDVALEDVAPDVPFDPAEVDPTRLGVVTPAYTVDPDALADDDEQDDEADDVADSVADVAGSVADVADVAGSADDGGPVESRTGRGGRVPDGGDSVGPETRWAGAPGVLPVETESATSVARSGEVDSGEVDSAESGSGTDSGHTGLSDRTATADGGGSDSAESTAVDTMSDFVDRGLESRLHATDLTDATDAGQPVRTDIGGAMASAQVDPGLPGFDLSSLSREPDELLWSSVVAQERAITQLRASARAPVHAYLFVGPPGAGEMEAALGFGAALLCPNGGCATCESCTRSLGRMHPDLTIVEREGASISVDQAREIIRLATRAPVEGNRKVLVLVDFHLVTVAGPTLLKIIEEPPPSTVFVILADHIPRELVTIASRCVQVPFGPVPMDKVVATLIAEGSDEAHAERAARAAGGRLDRARLLATDESVGRRLEFWEGIPRRLDGTGATVGALAAEAVSLLDSAAVGPLEARQHAELEALEARLEVVGTRGGVGLKKDLAERHKRELKRLRDDELRFGLGVLLQRYRDVAVDSTLPVAVCRSAAGAIGTIGEANETLEFNPNVTLLLQKLLLDLPRLR